MRLPMSAADQLSGQRYSSDRASLCYASASSYTPNCYRYAGRSVLAFPQIPDGLWAASVPGLIVFAGQRPNLILTIGHMSRYLIHYLRITTQYARAHPRGALGIIAGAMVGGVMAGAFDASGSLSGVVIMWGTLKAGYSAAAIASIIAAVRGSVKIITYVSQAGSAVATGANATRQTMATAARQLTALCRSLANAARRLMPHVWLGPPTQENTPSRRPISAA